MNRKYHHVHETDTKDFYSEAENNFFLSLLDRQRRTEGSTEYSRLPPRYLFSTDNPSI